MKLYPLVLRHFLIFYWYFVLSLHKATIITSRTHKHIILVWHHHSSPSLQFLRMSCSHLYIWRFLILRNSAPFISTDNKNLHPNSRSMNKNDFEERNLQQLYTLQPAIKYYTYQSFEENYWIYKYGNNFDWNNFDLSQFKYPLDYEKFTFVIPINLFFSPKKKKIKKKEKQKVMSWHKGLLRFDWENFITCFTLCFMQCLFYIMSAWQRIYCILWTNINILAGIGIYLLKARL